MSMATRQRVLQCYVEPILMYGCETWIITKPIQKKIEAVEMWFWRRMLKIPWTAKRTNVEVMEEAGLTRSFVNRIRKQQATFVGHILRGKGLEHLVITGENGWEMRKRKAKGTDDRQSCCMDGHRQDSVSDLGSQGQSSLERHDRQRLRAGHLRRRRRRPHHSLTIH